MARKFFETRYFGFAIGATVVALFLLLRFGTAIPERLELKVLDVHFNLKNVFTQQAVQEGVTVVQRNPDISEDILIVGIDFSTLSRFGKWPFPRYRHADLLNSFTRVSDPNARERSVFLDLFFVEPSENAYNDALLREAIRANGRTLMETVLDPSAPSSDSAEQLFERHEVLFESVGEITNVSGPWETMPSYFGLQPPLKPFGRVAGSYGHANFEADFDDVFRRQPLIGKSAELIGEYDLSELTPDTEVETERYQRLVWFDRDGMPHTVEAPLTEEILLQLRADMEASAPARPIDHDNDGEPDEYDYTVRLYQDHFVPAVTLSLALEYFNRSLEDLEVVIGSHIRIPEPQQFDPDSGEWRPHRVVKEAGVYDEEGNLVEEPVYETVKEILIPIDERGNMLVNFMGPRSSASRDGHQTFPVRPYAGYAARVPPPFEELWPPTKAVENKIIMVGAFAPGMAEDEKNTPYGLMYGVEVHANALNTILTNRFVDYAPFWMDLAILIGLTLVVSFMSSRLSTILSLIATLLLVIVFFFTTTIIFDNEALVINFTTPALAMLLTFVSIVVYRVVTEERDKRRIRETFGKYVSPKVVDQILEHPPELGGVDKELTVFFSDIRGFTTLSEAMTPQELVNHLNVYLTRMTDIILEYQGTLDKYVGDEIMCFWGAPLAQEEHAMLACKCALKQMEALRNLNEQWPPERRINIGIGLNSGIMTVGNMGSLGRMNYTLTGDNVNLGARLEGTNKQYGTNIIISEYTYGLVKERVVVRELDNIRVKGKNRPVQIYELIDVTEDMEPPVQAPVKKRRG
ncbi:MAG: CHASE2 domain-containing protein [Spirochaetaceae bacterium]